MELYTHMIIGFCVIIYLESRYGENGRFTSRNDAYSERRFFAFYVYIYVFCKNASASGVVVFEAKHYKTRGSENVTGVDFPL